MGKKKIRVGMFALALVFGLMFVGCKEDNSGPASIILKNEYSNTITSFIYTGLGNYNGLSIAQGASQTFYVSFEPGVAGYTSDVNITAGGSFTKPLVRCAPNKTTTITLTLSGTITCVEP